MITKKKMKSADVLKMCSKKWKSMESIERQEYIDEALNVKNESQKRNFEFNQEQKLGKTCERQLLHFKAAIDTFMMDSINNQLEGLKFD